jgi:hypothetical protein
MHKDLKMYEREVSDEYGFVSCVWSSSGSGIFCNIVCYIFKSA